MVKFPIGLYTSITMYVLRSLFPPPPKSDVSEAVDKGGSPSLIWASVLMLHAACVNFGGLMAVRAFLGVAEASCVPAFALVVGTFYKRSEQATRQGFWFIGQGLGGISYGIITWGIAHLHGTVATWKVIGGRANQTLMPFFFTLRPDKTHLVLVHHLWILDSRLWTGNARISSQSPFDRQVSESPRARDRGWSPGGQHDSANV